MPSLHEADLLHQADEVIEEPLFNYLAFVIPVSYCAELDMEAFICRWNHLAISRLHGTFHGAIEVGH